MTDMSWISRFTRGMREARQSDRGFTLPEVVVTILVTAMLAAAVGAVILGAFTLVTQAQLVATNGAQTQTVLNNFKNGVRNATRIVAPATATSMSYDFQRDKVCERHTYTLEGPTNGKYQLRHTVKTVNLSSGSNTCTNVVAALSSVAAAYNQVEVTGLGSQSKFTYYNSLGTEITPPGGGIPETACATPANPGISYGYINVSSVRLLLVPATVTMSNATQVPQEDQTQASVRAYALGLQCS